MHLETPRILLRNWIESDLDPWIEMNQDPQVMKYFPKLSTAEESKNMYLRIERELNESDFGLWAVEEKSSHRFMGFVGLIRHNIEGISFMPCVEIGWRLRKEFWGKGLATEAATEVLRYGIEDAKLETIYSFTAELNKPSIRVMERIGLIPRPELNFLHPRVEDSSSLKPHVVYSSPIGDR